MVDALSHASSRALSRPAILPRGQRGMVSLELVVAMAILLGVLFPLAYSFKQEQRLARVYYFRAVAMEIVDGEMEALVAGGWRAFQPGRHSFAVRAEAAQNLPPGAFTFTIETNRLHLEWRPTKANQGGAVTRTAALPQAGAVAP